VKLEHIPYFRHPWTGAEAYLTSVGTNELRLLSYGSLMNQTSATLTIPVNTSSEPAIGYGIRRIFNYRMSADGFERHGNPYSVNHVAALNVLSTGNLKDAVNGLLLHVPVSSVDELRKREIGYDLVPITAEHWEPRRPIPEPVFSLECPDTDQTIVPHLQYLKTCETGAQSVSDSFLTFFRNTTFLADDTRLVDWRRENNG